MSGKLDESWRIIVLGDDGVGKKSINQQFVRGQTPETVHLSAEDNNQRPAVVDIKKCLIAAHEISTSVYNSPDGERAMRDCDGAILLYDITSKSSFSHIQGYCDKLRSLTSSTFPMYLVANKLDATNERKVSIAEGKLLAETFEPRCPFIEASATTAQNVEHVYFNLVREIRRQRLESDGMNSVGKKRTNSSFKRIVSNTGSSKKGKGFVGSFKQVFRKSKE